jgi:hypothetical protein
MAYDQVTDVNCSTGTPTVRDLTAPEVAAADAALPPSPIVITETVHGFLLMGAR